jgi:hypothetical protein
VTSWGLTRKRDGVKKNVITGDREGQEDLAVVIGILLSS